MSKIDRIIDKELTWADNSMSLPMRLVKNVLNLQWVPTKLILTYTESPWVSLE